MSDNKIIISADIHFGVHGKCDDAITAMSAMTQYARSNNIETIFILGDLFHDRTSLKIDILYKVYQFFLAESKDLNFITFCGNHDMYLRNSWKSNSISHLCKLITIVDGIRLIRVNEQRFWVVPFIHHEEVFMKALTAIEKQYEYGDILLTHVGVNNAVLNECFLLKNWNIISFEQSRFDRVFTGHFHCYQKVGENVWYPGSIIPYRFDEGVVDHGFLVYDIETRSHEFIKTFDICGDNRPPDYVTMVDDHIDLSLASRNHVRIMLSRNYTNNEKSTIRTQLMDSGAIDVSWISPNEKDIEISKTINISNNDISTLFERWLDHDKPTKLDKALLSSLNTDIFTIAQDKMITEDEIGD